MRNIKLTIEYDGSRYQGWTRLGKNESSNTIFNKIQEVLRKMTGEFVVDLYFAFYPIQILHQIFFMKHHLNTPQS